MVVGSVFQCRDLEHGLISPFGTQLYGARHRVNLGTVTLALFFPIQCRG